MPSAPSTSCAKNPTAKKSHQYSMQIDLRAILAEAALSVLGQSSYSLRGGRKDADSAMSASLIGHLRSITFRLSTTAVSMSLTGSRFSSESALRPFHDGIRGRGGTIFGSALPSE